MAEMLRTGLLNEVSSEWKLLIQRICTCSLVCALTTCERDPRLQMYVHNERCHCTIVKSVSYSSVDEVLCSASAHEVIWFPNRSLTLCFITPLSYQPVEFSRKTLSPSRSCLLCGNFHTGRRRLLMSYFSLWNLNFIINHSTILVKKSMPDIEALLL